MSNSLEENIYKNCSLKLPVSVEEVSRKDFDKLYDFWVDRFGTDQGIDYSHIEGEEEEVRTYGKILTPIAGIISDPPTAGEYERFFIYLANIPCADQLCIKTDLPPRGWWRPYAKFLRDYVNDMDQENMRMAADHIAHAEQRGHYLELKFKQDLPSDHKEDRAVAEFTEIDGLIVSYKFRIPRKFNQAFNVRAVTPEDDQYTHMYALWTPNHQNSVEFDLKTAANALGVSKEKLDKASLDGLIPSLRAVDLSKPKKTQVRFTEEALESFIINDL